MSPMHALPVRAPFLSSSTLAVALMVLSTALGCNRRNVEPIRIGTAGPYLTATGADNLRGVTMAIAEVNERGGIDGRKLELVVGNDSASGEKAVKIAEGFIEDPSIVAVAGHLTSVAMIATAPLYDGKLAAVSPMATSPQLTNISPWVFRVTASDSTLGTDLARFAASQHWGRVAILYETDAWGRRLTHAFQREQRIVGGETISADPISTRGTAPSELDFGVYVRTYKKLEPDVLILIASNNAIGLRFLKTAAALNFRVPIVGSDGMSPQRLAKEAVADGMYFPSTFLTDGTDSVAKDFRARFKARYGYEADMYSALGYDTALAIIAAIREAGPDREGVRAALASEHRTVRGATGRISFAQGDRRDRFGGLVRLEHGVVKTHLLWKDVGAER